MGSLDENVFGKLKFKDLLEEIYNKSKKKDKQIEGLINELKGLIKEVGDATLLVPLIANYLDMGLKNDDQLVKIATIVQRIFNNNQGKEDSGFTISQSEREELEGLVNEVNKNK